MIGVDSVGYQTTRLGNTYTITTFRPTGTTQTIIPGNRMGDIQVASDGTAYQASVDGNEYKITAIRPSGDTTTIPGTYFQNFQIAPTAPFTRPVGPPIRSPVKSPPMSPPSPPPAKQPAHSPACPSGVRITSDGCGAADSDDRRLQHPESW